MDGNLGTVSIFNSNFSLINGKYHLGILFIRSFASNKRSLLGLLALFSLEQLYLLIELTNPLVLRVGTVREDVNEGDVSLIARVYCFIIHSPKMTMPFSSQVF